MLATWSCPELCKGTPQESQNWQQKLITRWSDTRQLLGTRRCPWQLWHEMEGMLCYTHPKKKNINPLMIFSGALWEILPYMPFIYQSEPRRFGGNQSTFVHVFPGKGADTRCCYLWVHDLLWFCGLIHPYPHHDSNQFPWQRVQKGKWKLRTGGKSLKNPTPNSQERKAPPDNHHISCSRCTSECHQASSTQPVRFFATPGTLDLSGLRNPRGFHWWVLWVVERPLSAVL